MQWYTYVQWSRTFFFTRQEQQKNHNDKQRNKLIEAIIRQGNCILVISTGIEVSPVDQQVVKEVSMVASQQEQWGIYCLALIKVAGTKSTCGKVPKYLGSAFGSKIS